MYIICPIFLKALCPNLSEMHLSRYICGYHQRIVYEKSPCRRTQIDKQPPPTTPPPPANVQTSSAACFLAKASSMGFDILPPQSVWLRAEFPQFYRPVLTPRSIELAVGRETHTPNRSVVPFVHFHFSLAVEIVHPHPCISGPARDKLPLLRMHRHARDFCFKFDRLEQLPGGGAGKEVCVLAGGDG